MPRDHDAAIKELRREALACEKGAQDLNIMPGARAMLRHQAAGLHLAAEHLVSVTGKLERAAARARKGATKP